MKSMVGSTTSFFIGEPVCLSVFRKINRKNSTLKYFLRRVVFEISSSQTPLVECIGGLIGLLHGLIQMSPHVLFLLNNKIVELLVNAHGGPLDQTD